VEQEFDRLLELGVIKTVRHAGWAAPVVVVKKPDESTRLCVDYSTGLNDALQLHQHPLPVPENISLPLTAVMYSHKSTSPMHIYMWNLMTPRSSCAVNIAMVSYGRIFTIMTQVSCPSKQVL
jgi:hypothetical protein